MLGTGCMHCLQCKSVSLEMASLPNSQLFSSTRYTQASVGTCAKCKIANIANVNCSRYGSIVHLPTRQQFSNVHLAVGLCHTAAILSRESKVVFFYLSSRASKFFTARSRVVKQSFFQSLGTIWPPCELGPSTPSVHASLACEYSRLS